MRLERTRHPCKLVKISCHIQAQTAYQPAPPIRTADERALAIMDILVKAFCRNPPRGVISRIVKWRKLFVKIVLCCKTLTLPFSRVDNGSQWHFPALVQALLPSYFVWSSSFDGFLPSTYWSRRSLHTSRAEPCDDYCPGSWCNDENNTRVCRKCRY